MATEAEGEADSARANAIALRSKLDALIERFRADTIVGEGVDAPSIVADVRRSLEEETHLLLSEYSDAELQTAVLLTHDETRRLPIHLACDKNAPFSVLGRLLDADGGKASITVPDKWGDLPLHTACSRHQTEVVRLLVESDASRRSLHHASTNGSLPIHAAVRYKAPACVVMLLLDGDEGGSTLLKADDFGQLPLHSACRNGVHPDVVDLLLRYDESGETSLRGDGAG